MAHHIRHFYQAAQLPTALLQRRVSCAAVAAHYRPHHRRAARWAVRHDLGNGRHNVALGGAVLVVTALHQVTQDGEDKLGVDGGREEVCILAQRPRTHLDYLFLFFYSLFVAQRALAQRPRTHLD